MMVWQGWMRRMLMLCALGAGSMFGYAEGDSSGTVPYVDIGPSFITNFDTADTAASHYVKVDVALRVDTPDMIDVVKYHKDALRNYLLLLLSAQDEATMSSVPGRENLRKKALHGLNAILQHEEGDKAHIRDIYFTNFVLQQS